MILISGIIILYFVSSTSCYRSNETRITTLLDDMRTLLIYVKDLDGSLQLPESYNELDKIKTHYWFVKKFEIKNGKSWINRFRKQYRKFVEISIDCIEDYLTQIKTIVSNEKRDIGTEKARYYFISYMDETFSANMALAGKDDREVTYLFNKLRDKLEVLRNTIAKMNPPPSSAPKKPNEQEEKHESDLEGAALVSELAKGAVSELLGKPYEMKESDVQNQQKKK